MGRVAGGPDFATGSADEISDTNATAADRTAEARTHAADRAWAKRTALTGRPVLILSSDDGLAPTGEAAAGGPKPTLVHMVTDYSFNDHRVALAPTVVQWLEANFPPL